MFTRKNTYLWLFGFIASVIFQFLIIYYWNSAKYWTIVNLIILIASVFGYGGWNFYRKYKRDVNTGLHQETGMPNSLLTESDIELLPEPVKKYIRHTDSIGKPKVSNFKIEFSGKIRKDEQSEWMPFTSEQYNFLKNPTRLFFMKAVMKRLPVAGYHCYVNGFAFMDIRLFSLFKVQFQDGEEMNIAETVTFFNDICCMAPAALTDKRINWLESDGNNVKASFTNNKITIYARLYFNDKGELVNFISDDRYAADAGRKLQWATPLKNYKVINGYNLASYAETIYSYPGGDLCYGIFKPIRIKYNCKAGE